MYVPANNNSIPRISNWVKDSCKKIKAPNATNPGVKTNKGRALLSSRFLIPSITQRNANAPKNDFIKRTKSPEVVNVAKSVIKKNGIARIRLNIAKSVENDNAVSLNKTFFSNIAAVAEKNAEINAKIYH